MVPGPSRETIRNTTGTCSSVHYIRCPRLCSATNSHLRCGGGGVQCAEGAETHHALHRAPQRMQHSTAMYTLSQGTRPLTIILRTTVEK